MHASQRLSCRRVFFVSPAMLPLQAFGQSKGFPALRLRRLRDRHSGAGAASGPQTASLARGWPKVAFAKRDGTINPRAASHKPLTYWFRVGRGTVATSSPQRRAPLCGGLDSFRHQNRLSRPLGCLFFTRQPAKARFPSGCRDFAVANRAVVASLSTPHVLEGSTMCPQLLTAPLDSGMTQ